jgi:hypothetical protein
MVRVLEGRWEGFAGFDNGLEAGEKRCPTLVGGIGERFQTRSTDALM